MPIFDSNHKEILSALISLKNKCIYAEKNTLEFQYMVNRNNLPFLHFGNFYSHFRDVCDLSIVFMINEELSNTAARHLCSKLIEELLADNYLNSYIKIFGVRVSLDIEDFKYSLSDIRALMRKRINGMVGSQMHDFSVSSFSTFEKWITILYSEFLSEYDEIYKEERRKKLKKAFEDYRTESDEESKKNIVERTMKLRGNYISFPDKINAIFKEIGSDISTEEVKHFKSVIEFLRIHRNTVHNGGTHIGKTFKIEHASKEVVIENGKPLHSNSYVESIALTGELVDIYTKIISSVKDIPIKALCIPQEDTETLSVLEVVVQDIRFSVGPLEENSKQLASFLHDRIGLSERSAIKFTAHMLKFLRGLGPDEEVNLLQVLSSDLRDY